MVIEDLLLEVAHKGWSDRTAKAFVKHFDHEIKRTIQFHMVKLGFVKDENELEQLRKSFTAQGQGPGVKSHLLDICQNTYSDFYRELAKGALVNNYFEGKHQGKVGVDFQAYLKGMIKHLILDNAGRVGLINHRPLSEKELFDRLADSKKPSTRAHLIGIAKGRFASDVRACLLAKYPEPLNNVIDYFFEQFCEPTYRAMRPELRKGNHLIQQLLDRFSLSDYEQGLSYRGTIPSAQLPYQARLSRLDHETAISEEEKLDMLATQREAETPDNHHEELREQRFQWWDTLLQGHSAHVSAIETQAQMLKATGDRAGQQGLALYVSCANLLESDSEAIRRNVRIFLVHYFSQAGPQKGPRKDLSPRHLTLASLEGLHLTWDEASKLEGKVPPDYSAHARIKERIGQEMLAVWPQLFGTPYPEDKDDQSAL